MERLQKNKSQQVCTNLKCCPKKKTKIYRNDKNNDNANGNENGNENDNNEDSKARTTRAKKPNERKFSNKIQKHESAIIYWLKDTHTVVKPL